MNVLQICRELNIDPSTISNENAEELILSQIQEIKNQNVESLENYSGDLYSKDLRLADFNNELQVDAERKRANTNQGSNVDEVLGGVDFNNEILRDADKKRRDAEEFNAKARAMRGDR